MPPKNAQVIDYLLTRNDSIPNNNNLPLLVYPQAVEISTENADPAAIFEELFGENAWKNSWRNGIFAYHHYHCEAHEVIGCYSGEATVQFGGDDGVTQQLQAGDVVVIPAGVAHKQISASPDFRVVGAYPRRQQPDMKTRKPSQYSQERKTIASVPVPNTDPVYGSDGPLLQFWN